MDYFNDAFHTFLGLDSVIYLAVNGRVTSLPVFIQNMLNCVLKTNVSGYVCNHGSPNGERDTASPRGRYGERPQRDSCLKIHM